MVGGGARRRKAGFERSGTGVEKVDDEVDRGKEVGDPVVNEGGFAAFEVEAWGGEGGCWSWSWSWCGGSLSRGRRRRRRRWMMPVKDNTGRHATAGRLSVFGNIVCSRRHSYFLSKKRKPKKKKKTGTKKRSW